MTLDSRVYIDSPKVSPQAVLVRMQEILGQYDEDQRTPAQMRTSTNKDSIGNEPMQNLPAWVIVYHAGERPIVANAGDCTEYCGDDYEGGIYHSHKPAHWACVSMDTSYGYRAANGMGCGDLHAAMIAELGQWLDERDAPWSWENEYTSEIHGGEDRYERLIDLVSGGFEASAWFRSSVLPALLAIPSHREAGQQ